MRVLLLVLCVAAACRDAPPPAPKPDPVRVVQQPPAPPVLEIEEAEPEGGVELAEVLADLERRTHDHDVILDVEDRCPDAPEDNQGFEDVDGCPDVM